jgi:hypothetical protein
VKNRVGIKMMQLDSIVEEKTTEKIRSREGQPSFDEMLEENQLIGLLVRPLISNGSVPLNDRLGLEKALINKCLKISFRALTWFPSISGSGGSLQLLPLRLGGTSLDALHPCGHEMLHSHTLGGCARRGGATVL